MRSLIFICVLGACSKHDQPAPAAEPTPPASALAALPDIASIDWANTTYDLLSLGTVKVTKSVAEFRLEEDDEASVRAVQTAGAKSEWVGKLTVMPPIYGDVDGDKHDEALIEFELLSSLPDQVPHMYGVFVYTLRGGNPELLDTVSAAFKVVPHGVKVDSADGAHHWAWDPKTRVYVGN